MPPRAHAGGRVAFTVWATPAQNIAWALVFDAVARHGNRAAADAPPPGGSLNQPEDCLRLLEAAGLVDRSAEIVRAQWPLPNAHALVAALSAGTVRMAALIAAQEPSALPAIIADIERQAERFRRDDHLAIPVAAVLARGRRAAQPTATVGCNLDSRRRQAPVSQLKRGVEQVAERAVGSALGCVVLTSLSREEAPMNPEAPMDADSTATPEKSERSRHGGVLLPFGLAALFVLSAAGFFYSTRDAAGKLRRPDRSRPHAQRTRIPLHPRLRTPGSLQLRFNNLPLLHDPPCR